MDLRRELALKDAEHMRLSDEWEARMSELEDMESRWDTEREKMKERIEEEQAARVGAEKRAKKRREELLVLAQRVGLSGAVRAPRRAPLPRRPTRDRLPLPVLAMRGHVHRIPTAKPRASGRGGVRGAGVPGR